MISGADTIKQQINGEKQKNGEASLCADSNAKRVKFHEINVDSIINCDPNDIFNESQYLKENTRLIFSTNYCDPHLWKHLEKLQNNLLELHAKEALSERDSSRIFKQHIYDVQKLENKGVTSKRYHRENLLYLLNLLATKIHENLEKLKSIFDDVRTLTPLSDLSYSEGEPGDANALQKEKLDQVRARPSEQTEKEDNLNEADKYIDEESDEEEIDVVNFTDDESDTALNICDKTIDSSTSVIYCEPKTVDTTLKVVNRSLWKNVEIDGNSILRMVPNDRVIYTDTGAKRQAFMLFIITKVIRLLRSGSYLTKRDLYYLCLPFCKSKGKKVQSPIPQPSTQTEDKSDTNGDRCSRIGVISQVNSTPSQASDNQQDVRDNSDKYSPSILDDIIDDLCCTIGCSKINLNILVQSKALVYGDLTFELETGETFNCLKKSEGVHIPNARNAIVRVESSAKFILVVEKDAILQRLINIRTTDKFQVILFTAKGYPDWNSRAFLRFLWLKLKIPTLIVTDSDPHGIEIAGVYRFGSLSLAYDSFNLALPHVKWLGLLPSDTRNVDKTERLILTSNDRRKLNKILSRPYILKNQPWADQIRTIKQLNYKVEIEGLDKKGDDEGLLKYFSNKIRHGSWI